MKSTPWYRLGLQSRRLFTAVVSVLLSQTAFAFDHPGLLHTANDFNRVTQKVNVRAQPWFDGWNKLLANPNSSSSYTMQGPVRIVYRGFDGTHPENYGKLYRDIAAGYQNALRWKISGDEACANKAVKILDAWGSTLTAIQGTSDRFLAAGIYGYQFANVAEIMRSYRGWPAANQKVFFNMMKNVFYPMNHDFLVRHNGACISHYWANWDACNVASVLAIGILLDDTAKFDEAVHYFRSGEGNGGYRNVAPFVYPDGLAQCQESGRDQGHTLFDVSLYGVICQMSTNQHVNLFVYNPWKESSPRMKAMFEYIAKYNLGNNVPYTPYNNCDNVNQLMISSKGRGEVRPSWELVYNYFVKVRGEQAPYMQQYASLVRPEGGGGDYGPNSGGYDQLGFGTLMYSR